MFDTNVLLDVLLNRQPFAEDSSSAWKLSEDGLAECYMSTLSFADLVCIMRKSLESVSTDEMKAAMSLIFDFVDLTASDLAKAAQLEWDDFEDALQSVSAERINADYIVTRHGKDFSSSTIPPITPSDLLQRFQER